MKIRGREGGRVGMRKRERKRKRNLPFFSLLAMGWMTVHIPVGNIVFSVYRFKC